MSQQPFAGVRVIEWAGVAAGPSAGQLLAVLGAEVIKVEHPTVRDIARDMVLQAMPTRYRPFIPYKGPTGKPLHASGIVEINCKPNADSNLDCKSGFDCVNRSKKSVELDIGYLAGDAGGGLGRDTFLELLESADVFLTNVPTKSQEKLGIRAQEPGLGSGQGSGWA